MTSVKDLEKQAKKAAKNVELTQKLIRDLQVQTSVTLDDDLAQRLQMKIARFTYRLNQEKDALAQSESRLRQVRSDFQRFVETNTP